MDDILYRLKKAAREYKENDIWNDNAISLNLRIIELDSKYIDSYNWLIIYHQRIGDVRSANHYIKVKESINKTESPNTSKIVEYSATESLESQNPTELNNLINEIYEIVKDYRADEADPYVIMTPGRVSKWINQFNENDKIFILSELKNIFSKQYYSKQKVVSFLKSSVETVAKGRGYNEIKIFLEETVFLDLQPSGKSQPRLLQLMDNVLRNNFQYSLEKCGSRLKKNYIYLDDVLCTGNTLFQDISEWIKHINTSIGRTYLSQLADGHIRLDFVYIFIHQQNKDLITKRFKKCIIQNFDLFCKCYQSRKIVNEIVTPAQTSKSESVTKYQQEIEKQVDLYCLDNKYPPSKPEFYRQDEQSDTDRLFSSPANRKRFENIIILKGIEILNSTSYDYSLKYRALGYDLPSHKNFGFGALCFTWRNVPNNCPLVFWYSGGGFYPLFVKK